MSALGTRLTILAGPSIPMPLTPDLTARVRDVTVTESDEGRSAFTITLDAGRSGPLAALDTPVLGRTPLRANNRVVLMVTLGVVPHVLMDGIVTETEYVPGSAQTQASVRITGQDLSLLLDRHEVSAEHVGLTDHLQVLAIAARYAAEGLIPSVIPPPVSEPPLPIERTPTQQGTDWAHLHQLAAANGFVCYVDPGPVPGVSTLYWGPPVRAGAPQKALSVDLGPDTTVIGSPTFREDVLGPEVVDGEVQDPRTGAVIPVRTFAVTRPPLAAMPVWAVHAPSVRTRAYRDTGISAVTALANAQARTDAAMNCVTGTGRLDGAVYGAVLRPRGLVGMRGAGWSHDGLWYVQQVVHQLSPGRYTADFTLGREGYGSTVPVVKVS
ncbi:hypothetical protein AVL62_13510 [Serinicoccus chungangensis]|uniref:Phage tail protein n=1 Tax=Serinicoccus chungangensis TaxID=767452 RepID=A0A0W8IBX3_9MICO|nr:hypothetical protein [Serinicoccus chungangensis]KUG57436.1 hypothetical protein AVL62_13510 [Serinicoccus chungangensis]